MPHNADGGQHRETREYPVTSDEPLFTSRRAVSRVAVAYAVAILIAAGAAGYIGAVIATERSREHTDRRFEVLERDLAQRRQAAAEANAKRDAQAAQVRAFICVVFDRLPRDAEVEKVRTQFQCTGPTTTPPPPPAPSPTPTGTRSGPGPPHSAQRPPDGGPGQPQPAKPVPRLTPPPAPAPVPTRAPVPLPPEPAPPRRPLLCLPVLGCLL